MDHWTYSSDQYVVDTMSLGDVFDAGIGPATPPYPPVVAPSLEDQYQLNQQGIPASQNMHTRGRDPLRTQTVDQRRTNMHLWTDRHPTMAAPYSLGYSGYTGPMHYHKDDSMACGSCTDQPMGHSGPRKHKCKHRAAAASLKTLWQHPLMLFFILIVFAAFIALLTGRVIISRGPGYEVV